MQTTRPFKRTARAVVLTWMLALAQTMQPVFAATPLADVPIAAKVAAKPNIVYTVDDSGSMNFTYLPDFVVGNYCRSGNNIAACGAIPLSTSTFYWPPVLASDFNHLAYNPNVNYTPPLKFDGTPLTNLVGTVTDALGNQISLTLNPSKIQGDPFLTPNTYTNFYSQGGTPATNAGKVNVLLYCNTDWPPNTTFGDANGEFQAGTGDWCRINGTKYNVSVASGAPAVNDDYNYPYQSSTGATGVQYFYRQLTFKTIWCDTTSPKWPRNGVITGCTLGGTPTCGGLPCPTTQQKCNQKAKTCDPVIANRTFNPAACKNVSTIPPGTIDPAVYCKPNVGGSDGNSPGTGNTPECTACTCVATFQPAGGNCSITGAACTGPYGVLGGDLAECPDQPVAPNGCSAGVPIYGGPAGSAACSAFTWDPAAGVYSNNPVSSLFPGVTLLQDSNANGEVCRHNNQNYAVGGLAGPFKYPANGPGNPGSYPGDVYPANAGAGQLGKFNLAATSGGCPAITNPVLIPRHYYTVDSVQFCNGIDGTVNGQWKGFGAGVCQTKNDFATYKNVKYGQFHRVGLVNDGRTFAYVDQVLGTPKTRTYAQESVNYANWYAYYRSRILAAKTTSSIAFSYLDDTYRVGFHILGPEPAPMGLGGAITWTNVNDWVLGAGNQRDKWYTSLFGIAPTVGKTPTASAMLRIGNLFQTGGSAGLPASVNPLPAATDPITLSCQSNYHILFTDGFTNQVGQPAVVGNQDSTIAAWGGTIVDNPAEDNRMPNLRAGVGGSWRTPNGKATPFAESGLPSVSNSLSDIATYYWVTDLRPGMKNDVPASPVKLDASLNTTDDINPANDIAWWQHLNFNAISFGSEGVLDSSNQTATLAAITAGAKTWTATTPNPFSPTNPAGNPSGGPSAIDDLWHATVNSRGKFVYAKSPLEVSYGLANILLGISNQRKARVGAAFGGQVLDATNNIIYEATIEQGWAGDVLKVQIDPATGAEVTTVWRANYELGKQLDPIVTGQAEPWFTNRKIVTINSSSGAPVPFLFNKISAAQLASLSPDPTQQQKMIAYLRGGNTFTSLPGPVTKTIEGVGIGQFRARPSAGIFVDSPGPPAVTHSLPAGLGDISNAQVAIVGPPTLPYLDATDPGYTAYAAAHAARSTRIVAAANDGMVHAIDEPTGSEVFAFMPKAVFRGVAGNVATEDVTAIQALTYQDGGVPIFHHHFYADSSPRVGDVDFTNGGGDWHTIVVGGLGKGGNSYYALDLTDPTAVDENAAAAKVMWEWTNADLKYSYGRPVIIKVRDSAYPSGRWVVMVTSGYNNPSGLGKLFIIDAHTGTLLNTISTGAGSGANPSGFAQIHAFVKDFRNQIAEQVYGGDLLGNMWRIDVSAVDSYKSAPAVLFAQLTDSSGIAQPVTTAPQIEIDINNGIDRYVFIGTGRLLDTTDLTVPTPPQQQTMYAIRDGTLTNIQVAGLPIQPRTSLQPINADGVSAIVGGAPNGWFDDLPATLPAAERIVVDVQADVNIALYIGTQIQNDPCVISLPANVYARDYTTAKSLLLSGGVPVRAINFPAGAVGATIVGRIQADGSQSLGALISKEIPGSEPIDIVNPITGPGSRLSWRLLTGQ